MNNEYWQMVDEGLNGESPLKLILKGWVEDSVGVVAVVYASTDLESTKEKIKQLTADNKDAYYMVYSVPLDTDLTTIGHYPSIAISKEDFE